MLSDSHSSWCWEWQGLPTYFQSSLCLCSGCHTDFLFWEIPWSLTWIPSKVEVSKCWAFAHFSDPATSVGMTSAFLSQWWDRFALVSSHSPPRTPHSSYNQDAERSRGTLIVSCPTPFASAVCAPPPRSSQAPPSDAALDPSSSPCTWLSKQSAVLSPS